MTHTTSLKGSHRAKNDFNSVDKYIASQRLHGRPVLYLAGWKRHYSLYPFTDSLVAKKGNARVTLLLETEDSFSVRAGFQ